jgi:hypothetical protein
MPQFTKKPEVVTAIRWSGRKRDIEDVFTLVGALCEVIGVTATNELHINPRAQTKIEVQPNDWIVRDGDRLETMKNDAFRAAFDPAPDPVP